jgi:hypothetical protein
MEERFLRYAFERDFLVNGPSITRMIRTQLTGWLKYRRHPDRRIRKRFQREAKSLGTVYSGAVWAARRWFKHDSHMTAKMGLLLKDLFQAFGLKTRLTAPVVGRFLSIMMRREQRRLARGWVYEPETYYEKTQPALAFEPSAVKTIKLTATGNVYVAPKQRAA